MPSEKSRYLLNRPPSPTADLDREETFTLLDSLGARVTAELIWQKSESTPSLRHKLAVMVLKSRLLGPESNLDWDSVSAALRQLSSLCEFEAEWRDCDSGWAQVLAEVASTLETLLKRVPLASVKSRIQEIIRVAEESSSQMDDCYSCGIEIERMERQNFI